MKKEKKFIIPNSSFINHNYQFDFYELGLPLFDEHQNLNEQVGLAKIREYIWYSETRSPFNDECLMMNDESSENDELGTMNYELGETIHNSTFINYN